MIKPVRDRRCCRLQSLHLVRVRELSGTRRSGVRLSPGRATSFFFLSLTDDRFLRYLGSGRNVMKTKYFPLP
jgi:hypothetical protein